MEQPPGYAGGGNGKVCRLHRALYGLKQAPRAWHKRLSEELESLGFTASSADAGLYTKLDVEAGGVIVIVIVYVDDMLIAADSMKAVNAFKATITAAFDAHDLGEAAVCNFFFFFRRLLLHDPFEVSTDLFGYPYGPAAVPPPHPL